MRTTKSVSHHGAPRRRSSVALLCLGCLLLGGVTALGGPRVQCDRRVHDFGERSASETVRTTFELRNVGDETLKVFDVKTSCGCTATKLEKEAIEPGETATLPVTLSLAGRNGPQSKTITLYTNDPKQAAVLLKLEGTVQRDFVTEPLVANFGIAPADKRQLKEVYFGGNADVEKPARVSVDSDAFRARWVEATDRKPGHLLVSTRPPLAQGSHRATIKVFLEDAGAPIAEVPASAFVPGTVRPLPDEVLLPPEGAPERDKLILLFGTKGPFKVKEVIAPAGIHVKTVRTDRVRWHLRLSRFENPDELVGQRILVHTDAKGAETVEIPIRRTQPPPPDAEGDAQ